MEIIYFLTFIFFLFPATVPAQINKPYDIVMLVIQNPYNQGSASPWTIHGLCQLIIVLTIILCQLIIVHQLLHLTLGSDVQAALTKAWPGISGKADLKFWEHEYEKHGSCTIDLLPTSNDYLLKGVYLWEQIKFDDLMGVGPGAQFMPNTQYDANTVVAAITSKYKVKTILICADDAIVDVRFCYVGSWVLVDCLDTQPDPQTVCTGFIQYIRKY
ncbi:putative ribonuclease T(2) [Rosa chinensis]|uniref:Putative ribonuclease T(2) n=1 Tax=Rosa chinensis TaxID=74649 RepID=A0A2P6RCZ4_ROSCH|nr:putative ribonuclease T(2) [Rosa chinensis]